MGRRVQYWRVGGFGGVDGVGGEEDFFYCRGGEKGTTTGRGLVFDADGRFFIAEENAGDGVGGEDVGFGVWMDARVRSRAH